MKTKIPSSRADYSFSWIERSLSTRHFLVFQESAVTPSGLFMRQEGKAFPFSLTCWLELLETVITISPDPQIRGERLWYLGRHQFSCTLVQRVPQWHRDLSVPVQSCPIHERQSLSHRSPGLMLLVLTQLLWEWCAWWTRCFVSASADLGMSC